jgi:hypothetical protein
MGGLLKPCRRDADLAVALRFGRGRTVTAPISPGLYADVEVMGCDELQLGEVVEGRGPGILAFDGDRRRVLGDGGRVCLRVERDGPNVIDVPAAMAAAAAEGLYVRS